MGKGGSGKACGRWDWWRLGRWETSTGGQSRPTVAPPELASVVTTVWLWVGDLGCTRVWSGPTSGAAQIRELWRSPKCGARTAQVSLSGVMGRVRKDDRSRMECGLRARV